MLGKQPCGACLAAEKVRELAAQTELGRGDGTLEGAAGKSDRVGVCCGVTCIGGSRVVSSWWLCEMLVPVRDSMEEQSLGRARWSPVRVGAGGQTTCWWQHVRT